MEKLLFNSTTHAAPLTGGWNYGNNTHNRYMLGMKAVGTEKSHPEDVALLCPKGGSSRHRAQGKKTTENFFSPYAFRLTSWSGKAFEI
jgi:hypothetical protein